MGIGCELGGSGRASRDNASSFRCRTLSCVRSSAIDSTAGDSVSMLSEAVAARKPVGLIPLDPNPIGQVIRLAEAVRGRPFRIRDLTKFWDELGARGLVGTVDAPRCGTLDAEALDTSCAAVRAAMEGRLPETVVRIRVSAGRRAARAATG